MMDEMNRKDANEILKRHNVWRRCDPDEPMDMLDSATDTGPAIDAVVGRCKWNIDDPDYGVWDGADWRWIK